MFVLALLICVVLRAFSAQARVVTSFNDCKEFFYKNTEPGGINQNAKRICQQMANRPPYYATLYSDHHKIPLYSAYIFDPKCLRDSGRPSSWYLEPQISKPEEQDLYFMVRESQNNKNAYKRNQAISNDYSETGYDRGHLNPNSFQCGEGRTATCTLTNVAPMDACFNRNQWGKWEKSLRTFLADTLKNDGGSATAFIVTGTVPHENLRIPQKEISEEPERVTVPSHIWTAVCYEYHKDDSDKAMKSFSFGYIGKNLPEGSISLLSVSELNNQLSELYSELSGASQSITIFDGDCFDDNNKLNKVQEAFKKLTNLPGNQGVQMSSDAQNTFGALKRAGNSGSISSVSNIKVIKLTAELGFNSMSTYLTVAEDLKVFAGSACSITNAKPQEREFVHDELRKRDVSGVSDAVECLLVPEKQMTAADGSPCSSITESIYSCQCETKGEIKSCCSSPCLYQHKLNSYRCYSGQTQIECSPRYSLITVQGKRCLDDHPCATYSFDYYWCKTGQGDKDWDFCSPPLWRSKAINGKYCRSNHACAKYGSDYFWCYTDDKKNWDYCCASDDCYSAENGQTCRSDHPCGKYNEDYLWCYIDDKNNWAKCCKNCR